MIGRLATVRSASIPVNEYGPIWIIGHTVG